MFCSSPMSTPEEDPFGWVGGTVDGKYRVDKVVGHGGFGIVYQAHHLGFEEKVALKCLRLPKELQGGDRDRFRDSLVAEGRLLLQLSRATTGVVQALDVGAVVSPSKIWTPYLVLEWLEGTPLDRDLLNRRKAALGGRTLGEALALLDGAVRALGVAHGMGIAHRDIKPANLFLVEIAGRPGMKVLDFGIAKVLAESDSVTRAFEETGGTVQAFTARYGAPEQFSRRFGATGPWTDVFALALVLIEVVLGTPALDGTDAAQLFVAASDKLIRPTLRSKGFDPGDAVEAVLATALSVDPRERYPNATAFWDALTSAAEREPARMSARPPTPDDSRPTRELGGDPSAPFSMSGGYPALASHERRAPSSQPTRDAADPATELSSSQGVRSADARAQLAPGRRRSAFVSLLGVGLLAAGAAVAAVFWLSGQPGSAGTVSRATSLATRLEDALGRADRDGAPAALPSAGSPVSAEPSALGKPKLAAMPADSAKPSISPPASSASGMPSAAIELPKPVGRTLGVPWPGTQFRQVPSGALDSKAVWLEGFRIVRRPEATPSLDVAFRACSEIGLGLCTEPQWELACSAFAEVGKDRAITDSIDAAGAVERGGEGCGARSVPVAASGDALGMCCDRSIGMTSKNLQKQFLSSTAGVLKKVENALNQHDANALQDLLEDKVKLDGVERSKASVVALLAQTFKATPDLIVTHESCDVSVQATKLVKRSKRGRKLVSYETNSWTAACKQLRHQRGETVSAAAEYVFSPSSKLRGISAKNQASE
jgi:serine/threonine protein kinase